jgi:uncharacterized protein
VLLSISLTTAAALALIHVWLSVRVSQVRRAAKVEVGDGGNVQLLRRIRAHANFVENAPFLLLLLIPMELVGANPMFLWAAAILFIVARLLHPFGMDKGGVNWMRAGGTAISLLVLSALAVWAVVTSYSRMSAANAPRHDGTSIRA